MGLINIVLLAALFASGYSEVVESSACGESNDAICKIGEVRVSPCEGGKTCAFKKGTNASLAFEFTPNFTTSNLKTRVFWDNGAVDVPFADFGSDDACTYTTCPPVAGVAQTLNYNLHVGTKLPKGRFPLKWKVWNADNADEICCFKIAIRLNKSKNK